MRQPRKAGIQFVMLVAPVVFCLVCTGFSGAWSARSGERVEVPALDFSVEASPRSNGAWLATALSGGLALSRDVVFHANTAGEELLFGGLRPRTDVSPEDGSAYLYWYQDFTPPIRGSVMATLPLRHATSLVVGAFIDLFAHPGPGLEGYRSTEELGGFAGAEHRSDDGALRLGLVGRFGGERFHRNVGRSLGEGTWSVMAGLTYRTARSVF
ncbi:MAG: hypothetical protein AAGF12_41355 [Myxococcota bacterium]